MKRAVRMAARFGHAILRMVKRLAPDTWTKRCIYAGLVLAGFSFMLPWLGWPAIGLLAAGVFLYTWKAFSWLRDHLLWKVRNRIIVVFLFAGIAPLCIASSISILVGWLWIGTLGTNLVTRHIEETVDRLDHLPVDMQLALLRTASEERPPFARIVDEILRENPDLTGLSISVFEDGRPLLASSPFDTPQSLPDWLIREDHFADVVYDSLADNRSNGQSDGLSALSFRAGTAIDFRGRNLYVLSYKPLGVDYRTKIWEDLGTEVAFRSGPGDYEDVTVYESAPSEVERSRLPIWGALHVPWAASFAVRSWHHGVNTVAILGLDLDPAHIFEATVTGDMLLSGFPPLFAVVIVLCAVFVCFEVISFMIGLIVSRRITTAVRGLYEGTEAIRAGRTDFRVEEKARDQLGELGRSFNTMAQSIEMLMDEEREKERIETELSMAREVQARFIPNVPPQRGPLELAGAWIPARTVSGDYYDFIEHRDRMLDIVVGDISGKGISAALMMAGLQASLRSQALDPALEGSPDRLSRLMSRLNVYLCHSTAPERFATVFICSYHMETARLNYCCAGTTHPCSCATAATMSPCSKAAVTRSECFRKRNTKILTSASIRGISSRSIRTALRMRSTGRTKTSGKPACAGSFRGTATFPARRSWSGSSPRSATSRSVWNSSTTRPPSSAACAEGLIAQTAVIGRVR